MSMMSPMIFTEEQNKFPRNVFEQYMMYRYNEGTHLYREYLRLSFEVHLMDFWVLQFRWIGSIIHRQQG